MARDSKLYEMYKKEQSGLNVGLIYEEWLEGKLYKYIDIEGSEEEINYLRFKIKEIEDRIMFLEGQHK